jgi:hypothetical protein
MPEREFFPAVKRSAPLRRRKRPNPVGRKALREKEALDAFRLEVSSRGWCEAQGLARGAGALRGDPVCLTSRLHRGEHAHHVVLRSQGGGHDPANGLWVCQTAHRYIHDYPEDARRLRLMRSSA